MNGPLAAMFEYNAWANTRLLDFCASFTPEQLASTVPGTFGSIGRTLQHLVGGQDVFLWRLDRDNAELEQRATLLRGPFQGLAALRPLCERSDQLLIAAARALDTDEEVVLPPWEGSELAVPRSFVLLHALYHGIEHRGQVCTTLTQAGVPPPDLDGWGYAADAGIGRDATG